MPLVSEYDATRPPGPAAKPERKSRGKTVKILKSAALIAAGLIALAGCAKKVDVAAIEGEVKQSTRDWIAAYNAGDADSIAARYTDDAIVMAPGQPAAAGREAIHAMISKDSTAGKAAGITLVINDGDTVGVSGDLAWHSGTYSVQDASGATLDTGGYMEVQQKVGDKWLIVRDIWNSDRPPAPAAATETEEAT
jgi:uncharacterized protein (TIGR02246 family)